MNIISLKEELDTKYNGFAVFIQKTGRFQFHAGVLYKFEQKFKFLHLAWDKMLMTDTNITEGVWLNIGNYFNDIDRMILTAYAENISNNNKPTDVRYGFDITGKIFNPGSGKFESTEENFGITCAGFVYEVFASKGFELIDRNAWPEPTETDIQWQKNISSKLHNRLDGKIGCIRVSPTEIVSSTQLTLPSNKNQLVPYVEKLESYFKN